MKNRILYHPPMGSGPIDIFTYRPEGEGFEFDIRLSKSGKSFDRAIWLDVQISQIASVRPHELMEQLLHCECEEAVSYRRLRYVIDSPDSDDAVKALCEVANILERQKLISVVDKQALINRIDDGLDIVTTPRWRYKSPDVRKGGKAPGEFER